ncbi:hypothetical protein [Moraxella sp. ZY210820]|uniref:hypothetical protein n=1 Tax=unclassified Moraxella TaxID=2685852 RepID=UPI0027313C97|nr:hypothetical protein [Moraxella sp. ZY210820]WLF83363.1 hypothetical protein LU301_08840 [Moraxella sp. ZY210820]
MNNEFLIRQAIQYLDGLLKNNRADELDLFYSIDELQHCWFIKENLNKTYSIIFIIILIVWQNMSLYLMKISKS